MHGRYIDQIIICSIYALKLIKDDLFKDKEIKFKGMISSCESLLYFSAEKVKKTPVDLSISNDSMDIISFYNKIYLTPMKAYFKSNMNLSTNTHPSGVLCSSLRDSIPLTFINYSPLLKEISPSVRAQMTPMTPLSQRLHAKVETLESPFLKSRPNLQTYSASGSSLFLKNKIALQN